MRTFLALLIFVLSAILSVKTVNAGYQLLMKITGSSAMFYSIKSKFITYFIVFMIYAGILSKILGF